jgi:hypothetical protein
MHSEAKKTFPSGTRRHGDILKLSEDIRVRWVNPTKWESAKGNAGTFGGLHASFHLPLLARLLQVSLLLDSSSSSAGRRCALY